MNHSYNTEQSHFNRDRINLLEVTGEASVQVAPDQAIITLGVITEDKDPALAQQTNATAITTILASLASLGIPEDHIKTTNYRIEPQYDYIDGKEIFKNYKVHHILNIKTNSIEKVGTIVDTAVKNGSNSVSDILFSLSNIELFYNKALSLALKNAHNKALAITQTLGVSLLKVPIKIEEIQTGSPPIFYQTGLSAAKATSTPIQPGELNISTMIKVDYTYQ